MRACVFLALVCTWILLVRLPGVIFLQPGYQMGIEMGMQKNSFTTLVGTIPFYKIYFKHPPALQRDTRFDRLKVRVHLSSIHSLPSSRVSHHLHIVFSNPLTDFFSVPQTCLRLWLSNPLTLERNNKNSDVRTCFYVRGQ